MFGTILGILFSYFFQTKYYNKKLRVRLEQSNASYWVGIMLIYFDEDIKHFRKEWYVDCASYTVIVLTKYYIFAFRRVTTLPSFPTFLRCLTHYQGLWVTATIKRVLVDIYLLWHYMVWWTMYLLMLKLHMLYPVRWAKYRDARKMRTDKVAKIENPL